MLRDKPLQIAGPISVIAMIWCAELVARALAIWPNSSLLWYLNLEVFQSFRYSFDGFGFSRLGVNLNPIQSLWLPVALSCLIASGLVARMKLPLAIASNLSLIYSGVLLYSGFAANHMQPSDISKPTCFLATVVLAISLFSSTISHRGYWRELFY